MAARIDIADREMGGQNNHGAARRIRAGAPMLYGGRFVNLKAANFNGSDEYAYIDNPSFAADTAGTWAGWLRMATLLGANGNKGIIGWGMNTGADDSIWMIRQVRTAATSNQNRFQNTNRITNGGTTITNNGDTALVATTLYHAVVASSGTETTMYLNNVAQTLSGTNSGNWIGDLPGGSKRLTFGAWWTSNAISSYNDCRMDEWLYVTGRALTAGEVTEHYNGGVPKHARQLSFRADIRSWWRMGDRGDTATMIMDHWGSNHLTLVNMDASNYSTP